MPTVSGCEDIPISSGTELVYTQDGAVIKCSGKTFWQIKCVNNMWQGEWHNCTQGKCRFIRPLFGQQLLELDVSHSATINRNIVKFDLQLCTSILLRMCFFNSKFVLKFKIIIF